MVACIRNYCCLFFRYSWRSFILCSIFCLVLFLELLELGFLLGRQETRHLGVNTLH